MQQISNRLKLFIKLDSIWWLLIAGGIVLRLRLYYEHLSFGNDEAALALNIVNRTFSSLIQPLDYNQGAPIVFLFIEKILIDVMGNKDFVFRLFPLFSGLVSIYLFYLITRKYFGNAGLFATFAFSISWPLLSYSSDLKQYSSDVMIALLLVYLAGNCISENVQVKSFLVLGVAGTVAIWTSHPSVLVLPGITLVMAFQKLSRKDYGALIWSLALGCIWAATLGIDFVFFLRPLAASSYLANYWREGFMPLPPLSNPRWFVDTYLSLLSMSLNKTNLFLAWGWFIFSIIGIISLLTRKRGFALLILLPFAMALAASALQVYPLRDRLLLFLVPFVYLLVAEGLGSVYFLVSKWNRNLALITYGATIVALLWPAIIGVKRDILNPIQSISNMRPIVEYMSKRWKDDDLVFVSGGGKTFEYYATSYGLKMNYSIIEISHRLVRWQTYTDDLDTLAGKKHVWIVFSYFEEDPHSQYAKYVRYLHNHGSIDATFRPGSARVYLCSFYP